MSRRKKGLPINGWVVLDKPLEMTSTQAVGKVRRLFNAQKAGHAGTLDPLATGVLPIALGEATKTVPFLMDGDKTYRFVVAWGSRTDTDDLEGVVVETSDVRPSEDDVLAALPAFTGDILQTPPQYSAVKIGGERAYDIARDGETVALAPRPVFIETLRIVSHAPEQTIIECDCGKGTYVRSLARDLGEALGTCAHVAGLRRTRVGSLTERDLVTFEDIEAAIAERGEADEASRVAQDVPDAQRLAHPVAAWDSTILRSVETALDDIPAVAIGGSDASRLRNGQSIILRGRDAPLPGPAYARHGRELIALGEVENGELHPRRVFNL